MAKVYIKTAKAQQKTTSEDCVLAGSKIFSNAAASICVHDGAIAVADGVGGNAAGEVASREVCRALAQCQEIDLPHFQAINRILVAMSEAETSYHNMATTLSGISIRETSNITYFHVGNTRIYAIQASQYLKQLTEDDTTVNFLVKTGRLTEEEAENFPSRNEITACLGGGNEKLLQMSIRKLPVHMYSLFLLTSDGVHETLDIDEMEDVLAESEQDWLTAVCSLVARAQTKGSMDDCSAVIIDCIRNEE